MWFKSQHLPKQANEIPLSNALTRNTSREVYQDAKLTRKTGQGSKACFDLYFLFLSSF